jgi:SNF2 family DNA or RNA helicase
MTFTGTLLPYQPEAVNKMIARKKMLVAYDLGLGKTVLTIAAIEQLMDSGQITEPGIVICLSSLKYQWESQIEKFTGGSSRALVIDGTKEQRAAQYHSAFEWRKNGIDYVIINYEQVVNDWQYVSSLPRGFVVADEATAIKSFKSKRSRYVKQLDAQFKFALTGTPVENGKPEEIYSIMQFVDSRVLGRFDLFDSTFIVRNQFGGVERYRNIPTLHKTLAKAIVRKRQSDPDVAPFLPEEIRAEPILVEFDRKSSVLYRQIVTEVLDDLDEALNSFGPRFDIFSHYGDGSDQGGIGDQLRGKIMSKLTALRMLCDHPDLLRHSADIFNAMTDEGSKYAWELKEAGMLQDLKSAPKLDVLIDFVDEFLDEYEGNKVVIFTSYVLMTDIIAKALDKKGYKSSTYTGQMDAKTKEASKVEFQTNPECRVLISSDAGGYGVDLPQANMLINYDLPWNAGLAIQRNGRIMRASSAWKSVVIQDILMDGSIEERQHAMLEQKNAVANAVVDGQGINDKGGVNLTAGSLRAFLQSTIV